MNDNDIHDCTCCIFSCSAVSDFLSLILIYTLIDQSCNYIFWSKFKVLSTELSSFIMINYNIICIPYSSRENICLTNRITV